jgi:hypothetical protein
MKLTTIEVFWGVALLKLRRLACREAFPASREATLARDYVATPLVATSAFEVRACWANA